MALLVPVSLWHHPRELMAILWWEDRFLAKPDLIQRF
jgi:hypothetical protein